jgi:hypothetical protein
MGNSLSASLHIGFARTGVTLLRRSGWLRTQMEVLHDSHAESDVKDASQAAAELGRILAERQCSGMRASVVVADDCARFFMVTPPANTGRLQDCHAAARMRFQSLYGEMPAAWQLSAAWDMKRPFLACALPQALLDVLQNIAADNRLTLLQVMPCFVAVWNRCAPVLKPGAWLAVLHGETVTLGIPQGKRLSAVRSLSVPLAQRHAYWLPDLVAREAMRLDLAMPEEVKVWGGLSTNWADSSDERLTLQHIGPAPIDASSAMSIGLALAAAGVRR